MMLFLSFKVKIYFWKVLNLENYFVLDFQNKRILTSEGQDKNIECVNKNKVHFIEAW